MKETLDQSNLGLLKTGDLVNLERCLLYTSQRFWILVVADSVADL